jgi:hypothetical protein
VALVREELIMDVGTNQKGYRWVVDDERTLGQGYVARLWRDDRATVIAARKGFSTREGAVEWATSYEGGDASIAPMILAGFGFLFGFVVTAAFIRMVTGAGEVRITTRYGRDREPERTHDGGSRARATARPIVKR